MSADFDRAEERAYQNRIEANDARAAQIALAEGRITAELVLLFIDGLNGNRSVRMPYARISMQHGNFVVENRMFTAALYDTLYALPILEQLLGVLAHSECPMVAQIKVAMSRHYAELHAANLAEAEFETAQ